MYDLMTVAYQADLTRVFTFMSDRELSQRTYPQIGVTEQHHTVSHHGNDPENIAKVAKINIVPRELFAKFLEKLRATPDGDGSLLDHSLIFYGGGMGNPEPARQRSAAAGGGRRRRRAGQSAHQARAPHAGRQSVADGREPVRQPDRHARREQRARGSVHVELRTDELRLTGT